MCGFCIVSGGAIYFAGLYPDERSHALTLLCGNRFRARLGGEA
jgi:hypothetical protein